MEKEKKKEIEEIAVTIEAFKKICTNSEKIFGALLLKAGKTEKAPKINENKVLRNTCHIMEIFIENIKDKVRIEK